ACGARRGRAEADERRRGAAGESGRSAPALRAGPGSRVAGGPDDRPALRSRRGTARAPRRGALVPVAGGARSPMRELALALFAASRDVHASDGERKSARFAAFLDAFDEAAERSRLADAGIRWLPRSGPGFPRRLASIPDPPPGLCLRAGVDPELLSAPSVAIVGARACSDYGAHVARSLARELAGAGVAVVSGLARGVDGWAHRGCLESHGRTIAVLGCGVERDYPRA